MSTGRKLLRDCRQFVDSSHQSTVSVIDKMTFGAGYESVESDCLPAALLKCLYIQLIAADKLVDLALSY